MQSETVALSATPTADTWTLVGTFTVPAGVARLVRVNVGIAPDPGGVITARFAPVIRLIGSGLGEQSPHQYLCPAGNWSGPASSGDEIELGNEEYEVDIPVTTGGTFQVQSNFLDEGAVPQTTKVQVVYDSAAPSGRNSMSDYVDSVQPTAADAWQTVGTIVVPKMSEANNPKAIREICLMHATDMAASAVIRSSSRFRLTGAGIGEGGAHEYLGPSAGAAGATTGAYGYSHQMVRQKVTVPVNPGGSILVEALIDSELPTGGTVAVGVLYE